MTNCSSSARPSASSAVSWSGSRANPRVPPGPSHVFPMVLPGSRGFFVQKPGSRFWKRMSTLLELDRQIRIAVAAKSLINQAFNGSGRTPVEERGLLPGARSPVHRSPVAPGRVRRGHIWLAARPVDEACGESRRRSTVEYPNPRSRPLSIDGPAGRRRGSAVPRGGQHLRARTWSEPEDGVLWTRGPGGRRGRAGNCRGFRRAARVQLRPGDILEAIDRHTGRVRRDVMAALHRASTGERADSTPSFGRRRPNRSRSRSRRFRRVRAACITCSRRSASSRCSSARRALAPAGPPGDAAFLLADGRVLRHAGVLVQRAARHARLGDLLGGRDRRMLLLPPLFVHFALVFPDRPDALGAQRRRAHAAAAVVPAGAAARRRARGGAAQRRASTARCSRRASTLVERAELSAWRSGWSPGSPS